MHRHAMGLALFDQLVHDLKQPMNVIRVVAEAGGRPENVTSLTIYLTDKRSYIAATKEIGGVYRELMGRHYPSMALVQVADLLEDGALVEIQGVAALPSD